MAQTEVHIKSGGFAFDTTFEDGDADARRQAFDAVAFILGNRSEEPAGGRRRRPRHPGRPSAPLSSGAPTPEPEAVPPPRRRASLAPAEDLDADRGSRT